MSLADQRNLLYSLLGRLPLRDRPIAVLSSTAERTDYYTLHHLALDLNGIEPVPALLCLPHDTTTPVPAVLYNHSHGGNYALGKSELTQSREYLHPIPYAQALTQLGFAVLAIDHWCFGRRNHTSELDTFKRMLWHGQSLWGMMTYDSLRALDFLCSHPQVDPNRIATLGMSMGSTMAWWLAALDERIKVCVDLFCLTDFHALIEHKSLHRHGIYYYVPDLLTHFTTADINALIAPRPHLAVAGLHDLLTPQDGLDRIEHSLTQTYAAHNAPGNFRLLRYDTAHRETEASRAAVLDFLRLHL